VDLTDPRAGPGYICINFADLATQLRAFAGDLFEARCLDQPPEVEIGDAPIALVYKVALFDQGFALRLEGGDFFVDLSYAEFKLLTLVLPVGNVARMQARFAGHEFCIFGIGGLKPIREPDFVVPVAVGHKPGPPGFCIVKLGREDREFGDGLGLAGPKLHI